MKFARLFHNPFLEAAVSHAELLACTTETRERLVANNPGGAFDDLIAGITGAVAELRAASVSNMVKLGNRKGAKLTKRKFRREMPGKLARIAGAVMAQYGSRSGEMRQVFPNGRRQFLRTVDDLLGSRLSSLVTVLTALAGAMGDLGTMALGLAQELQTSWTALHGASEQSTGQKAAAEQAQREARVKVGAQMHLALLTVTAHFVRAAAAAGKVVTKKEAAAHTALYFRQDLLKDRTRRKKAAPAP